MSDLGYGKEAASLFSMAASCSSRAFE